MVKFRRQRAYATEKKGGFTVMVFVAIAVSFAGILIQKAIYMNGKKRKGGSL